VNITEYGENDTMTDNHSKTIQVGDFYGKRLVLSKPYLKQGSRNYHVQCFCWCCGKLVEARYYSYEKGIAKACLKTLKKKERQLKSRWKSMMERCYYEKSNCYQHYGGRGIEVCKRWHNPKVFIQDLMSIFDNNLVIDRIDNNGHYEPNNVRFVDYAESAQNRRNGWETRRKNRDDSIRARNTGVDTQCTG